MNARARNLTPEYNEPIVESSAAPIYRMTRSQLFVAWSVVGMMLLAVFLFGFYSGRKQGVELALSEQSVPRLRLPVESPKARAALSTAPIVVESNSASGATKFDFTDSRVDSFAVDGENKAQPEAIVIEPRKEINSDSAVGFIAKAANEIPVRPQELSNEVNQKVETTTESLAERVAKVELSPALKTNAVSGDNLVKVEKNQVKLDTPVQDKPLKVQSEVSPKVTTTESKLNPTNPVKKLVPVPVKPSPAAVASGLFVQVGAPDSFAKAQSMVSKLKARGLTAAIRDASVNNKQHYRVLVGPFSSRDSAQNAKNQVIKSGVAMGEPFIKNY